MGQRIFTPTKTYLDPPDPRDRPYAGWLYVMGDWRTRVEPTVDHLTVTVGVVGPGSLARQAQDLVHHVLNEAPSAGWSSQLHSEPTAMVAYERAWPAIARGALGAASYDVSTRVGASVGTPLTYASAGTVFRYGNYLPLDLPVTHISLGPPRDGFRGAGGRGWYAWAGLDARAVARNTFIDGNTFRDSASVKREPFGFDLQIGIAHVWRTARIGFALIQRSREFEGQPRPDRFGQLALSFAY